MDTKLTLKLDKDTIERAKEFAASRKISLSRLIEAYLQLLIQEKGISGNSSPLVQSLSGVIKDPGHDNGKNGYSDFLSDKYK